MRVECTRNVEVVGCCVLKEWRKTSVPAGVARGLETSAPLDMGHLVTGEKIIPNRKDTHAEKYLPTPIRTVIKTSS